MSTYRITIYDAATANATERDMTPEEIAQAEQDAANAYPLTAAPE